MTLVEATDPTRGSESVMEPVAPWTPPLRVEFAEEARGCRLRFDRERWATDWVMAFGATILGYGDPQVDEAVVAQIRRGSIYSVDCELRRTLARTLVDDFPSAEQALFLKTGSEATLAAVRIARHHTQRSTIVRCGYQGWYDWCSSAAAVPDVVRSTAPSAEYNDLATIEALFARHHGDVAGLILQPGGDPKVPDPGFLETVAALCDEAGAILIFDETRTGLRMGRGGAQEFFGVRPQLTTVSKGLANGLPLSSLLGPRRLLRHSVQAGIGGTYQREVLSIAAAVATLHTMHERDTVDRIWSAGDRFMCGIRRLGTEYPRLGLYCKGYPPMPRLKIGPRGPRGAEFRARFYDRLFEEGVLMPPDHHLFLAEAHDRAAVDQTLAAIGRVCSAFEVDGVIDG